MTSTASASYAFVSLLTSDAYLPGALALSATLRDLHTTPDVPFQTVCLVSPESVDISTVRALRAAFDLVVGVELIVQEDHQALQLLGRLDLSTVLTKLHVFRLTRFTKIIFLDADVLPVQPISHLFALPHEFSAVPDVGWPDIFNSGVMVLTPGEEKFTELIELLKSNGSWDGGDQGLLNEWRAGNWNRLSFVYNTTPTAAYTYAPAYQRFGSKISAIHFIGPNKPWNNLSYRPPFASNSSSDPSSKAYDYDALVDRWYAVYDKHYRSQESAPRSPPRFNIPSYTSVWHETYGSTSPPTSALSLDELRRMAIEGVNATLPPFETTPTRGQSSNVSNHGEYRSMPLDGRIDLMRPKIEVQKDQPRRSKFGGKDRKNPKTLQDLVPLSDGVSRRAVTPQSGYFLPNPEQNEMPPRPHPRTIALPPATPSPRSSRPQDLHPLKYGSPLIPGRIKSGDEELEPERRFLARGQDKAKQFLSNGVTTPMPSPLWPSNKLSDHLPQSSAPPLLHQALFANQQSRSFQPPLSPPTAPMPTTLFQPQPHLELLGKDPLHSTIGSEDDFRFLPSPDPTKVKNIFPWEEKPRRLPGRVFPETNSPKPSLFLSPETTSSSEMPTTPEFKSGHLLPTLSPVPGLSPLPPLVGLPVSVGYTNTWDTIPSIQKYAEKFVHPTTPKRASATPFQDQKSKRLNKDWEQQAEVNSQDGDVEDEGDDTVDEEHRGILSSGSDDSLASLGVGSSRHSPAGGRNISVYRDVGVQTDSREMRDECLQISMISSTSVTPPGSHDMHSFATTRNISIQAGKARPLMPQPASDGHRPSDGKSSPLSSLRSPISSLSPPLRLPSTFAPLKYKTADRPPRLLSTSSSPSAIARQASNDSSSLTSPLSSTSPPSPSDDGQFSVGNSPPFRKGGRVWDPARGVELFKRGSEEVLARFLKMGWQDEQP